MLSNQSSLDPTSIQRLKDACLQGKKIRTLWKFVQNDIAISLISLWYNLSRYSGQERATPAQAASTWIQREG